MIDYSKKQLLEQWNLDRMQIKEENEMEKRNMKEQFDLTITDKVNTLTVYYEGKVQDLESACATKLKTLNKKFSDDLLNLKEKHEMESIHLNSQIEILRNEISISKSLIEQINKEKNSTVEKLGLELDEEKIRSNDLMTKYEQIVAIKMKMQNDYEEKIANVHKTIIDREKILKMKFETEKNVIVNHILNEKYELEAKYEKKISELKVKIESLKEKYAKASEKKTVIRINDTGNQRIAKEMLEKDKIINQLIKEKANLQTSLEYMNSTVRIFSTQEKTFHTKSNSGDSRTPKATIKNVRYGKF